MLLRGSLWLENTLNYFPVFLTFRTRWFPWLHPIESGWLTAISTGLGSTLSAGRLTFDSLGHRSVRTGWFGSVIAFRSSLECQTN